MMLPDRSLIRCFLTWSNAEIFIVLKAIIPNNAASSQLIRNDSMTERINSGSARISAITGALIMRDPIRSMGIIF